MAKLTEVKHWRIAGQNIPLMKIYWKVERAFVVMHVNLEIKVDLKT